jgi:GTPase involved in cell partitioning and DNA repair
VVSPEPSFLCACSVRLLKGAHADVSLGLSRLRHILRTLAYALVFGRGTLGRDRAMHAKLSLFGNM